MVIIMKIKKRILSIVIILTLCVASLCIPVSAFDPLSPGLWVEEYVMFTKATSVGGYHTPTNPNYQDSKFISNISNKTITVDIPYDSTFIMFRYWDYGNPQGSGWITGGTVSYRINGSSVTTNVSGGSGTDGYKASGVAVIANRHYLTFRTSQFSQYGTDVFTIRAYRVVGGVAYDYTITYNINWV